MGQFGRGGFASPAPGSRAGSVVTGWGGIARTEEEARAIIDDAKAKRYVHSG